MPKYHIVKEWIVEDETTEAIIKRLAYDRFADGELFSLSLTPYEGPEDSPAHDVEIVPETLPEGDSE